MTHLSILEEALEVQRLARGHYGHESQDLKTAEECSELTTVLLQSQSRDVTKEAIVTEAADVVFSAIGLLDSLDGFPELKRKVDRLKRKMEMEL